MLTLKSIISQARIKELVIIEKLYEPPLDVKFKNMDFVSHSCMHHVTAALSEF
jgi:hypothetical protein